jgi:hypothetical protein
MGNKCLLQKKNAVVSCEAKIQEVPNKKRKESPYIASKQHAHVLGLGADHILSIDGDALTRGLQFS